MTDEEIVKHYYSTAIKDQMHDDSTGCVESIIKYKKNDYGYYLLARGGGRKDAWTAAKIVIGKQLYGEFYGHEILDYLFS